jgi:hypothetical protein
MWETISDLNVHVQVAKASIFFRRYTFLKILPKIGTGLILLAPIVYIYIYIYIYIFGFVGYKNFWQSAQRKTRAYLN